MHAGWGRGASTALLAMLCFFGFAGAARADDTIDVGPTPVLNVHLGTGKLTVRTWDQRRVSVQTAGSVRTVHLAAARVDPRMPKQIQIPAQTISGSRGSVTLSAESFVLPHLAGTAHDAIVARGNGDTIITVPRSTALIVAHVGKGRVSIQNYSGVFVAHVRSGGVYLNHVSGTGFAETLRGPVVADKSDFTRVRARTAFGNMFFRGCTSHQIVATSGYGSIVYDNGKFQPGLARFESEHGNVALGLRNDSGGVQIGAHAGSGHVVSSFGAGTQVDQTGGDAEARVRGGGPVVTANSKNGSVYLYNGSMRNQPPFPAMRPMPLPASARPAPRAVPRYQAPRYPGRSRRPPRR